MKNEKRNRYEQNGKGRGGSDTETDRKDIYMNANKKDERALQTSYHRHQYSRPSRAVLLPAEVALHRVSPICLAWCSRGSTLERRPSWHAQERGRPRCSVVQRRVRRWRGETHAKPGAWACGQGLRTPWRRGLPLPPPGTSWRAAAACPHRHPRRQRQDRQWQ